jgi:hypothetical protein
MTERSLLARGKVGSPAPGRDPDEGQTTGDKSVKPVVLPVGADKGGVGKTTIVRTLLDSYGQNIHRGRFVWGAKCGRAVSRSCRDQLRPAWKGRGLVVARRVSVVDRVRGNDRLSRDVLADV